MPELPEVETIRRQLAPRLTGRPVLGAGSHPSAKFTPAIDAVGARLVGVERRGKFLLIPTGDGREIVVHLGMTGALHLLDPPRHATAGPHEPPKLDDRHRPYLRAWWRLGPATTSPPDGTDHGLDVAYVDVRRFGRIRVVPAGDYHTIPTLAAAGPEPFDPRLDGDAFHALLARSRRKIKTQLLSQRPVAGVGNIYADEALWLASINPRATRLGRNRAAALLDAVRQVLTRAIDNGGTTFRDYRDAEGSAGRNQATLAVYGRAGQPCPRCGTELAGGVIDARGSTWCPLCQRR